MSCGSFGTTSSWKKFHAQYCNKTSINKRESFMLDLLSSMISPSLECVLVLKFLQKSIHSMKQHISKN